MALTFATRARRTVNKVKKLESVLAKEKQRSGQMLDRKNTVERVNEELRAEIAALRESENRETKELLAKMEEKFVARIEDRVAERARQLGYRVNEFDPAQTD